MFPSTDRSPTESRPDLAAPIRVLLVDGSALFRHGLRATLEPEEGIELVGEADSAQTALELAAGLVPDVVLLDLDLPERAALGCISELLALLPAARVIALTMSEKAEDLVAALQAGARGYLLKSVRPDHLAHSICLVHQDAAVIAPTMTSKLLAEFRTRVNGAESTIAATPPPIPMLSSREIEVLEQIALGHSNREVGLTLYIAENTVKNHVRNILDKLGLENRMEAVLYAARAGLITLEPEAPLVPAPRLGMSVPQPRSGTVVDR